MGTRVKPSNSRIDTAAAGAGRPDIDNFDELLDLYDRWAQNPNNTNAARQLDKICTALGISESDLNDWLNERQQTKPVKTRSANDFINDMIENDWDLDDLKKIKKKTLGNPHLTDAEREAWEDFFDNVEDGYKDYKKQVKKGIQDPDAPYDPDANFDTSDHDND
jgi:hypothetical protein